MPILVLLSSCGGIATDEPELTSIAAPNGTSRNDSVDDEQYLPLSTAVERASYGLGLNIGRNLQHQNFVVELESLLAGIKDSRNNLPVRVNESQIEKAFAEIQNQIELDQKSAVELYKEKNKQFLVDNAKKEGVVTLSSGLQYKILKQGLADSTSPADSDTVNAHYQGRLIDGRIFMDTQSHHQPTKFTIGQTIPGFSEALSSMKIGEKRQLFIPSELAYGDKSPKKSIPAYSTLIFDLELVSIEDKNKKIQHELIDAHREHAEQSHHHHGGHNHSHGGHSHSHGGHSHDEEHPH